MNKKIKKQIIYLILAAIWGIFIFYLSSIPNLNSGLPTFYDFVLRKLAHIFVFFVLTYLTANALNSTKRLHLSFIILAIVYYAFLDEFHQTTVINRSGNYIDILIDSIGIFLGIAFFKNKKLPK